MTTTVWQPIVIRELLDVNDEPGVVEKKGAAEQGTKRKRGRPTKGPCEHGVKYRSQCKVCLKCDHGRNRYACKECGGSGICEHGRQRRRCKDCIAAKAGTKS